jgi:hypothetical protein
VSVAGDSAPATGIAIRVVIASAVTTIVMARMRRARILDFEASGEEVMGPSQRAAVLRARMGFFIRGRYDPARSIGGCVC